MLLVAPVKAQFDVEGVGYAVPYGLVYGSLNSCRHLLLAGVGNLFAGEPRIQIDGVVIDSRADLYVQRTTAINSEFIEGGFWLAGVLGSSLDIYNGHCGLHAVAGLRRVSAPYPLNQAEKD